MKGYSDALRQWEFTSAFRAEMKDYLLMHGINYSNYHDEENDIQFHFQNALSYSGPILDHEDLSASLSSATLSSSFGDKNNSNHHAEFEGQASNIPHLLQVQAYESAMQYVTISARHLPEMNTGSIDNALSMMTAGVEHDKTTSSPIIHTIFINAVHRCSLIRTAFQIVAGGGRGGTDDEYSYEELAIEALENKSFDDMIQNEGINVDATWSIRLRRYGPMEMVDVTQQKQQQLPSSNKRPPRQARYGKNVRSPLTDERQAILSMAELVKLFRGKVNLENPMCSIYLLEGLQSIRMSSAGSCDAEGAFGTTSRKSNIGEKSSSSKLLARVVAKGPKFTILDPFAGSCATLLAASHIATLPTFSLLSSTSTERQFNPSGGDRGGGCRSVAIEVAHNGFVNRADIVQDFIHRSLPPPLEIIRGNCFSPEVRHRARMAIGGGAFDAIVTDPPYGIREALGGPEKHMADGTMNAISPLTELFDAMGHDRLAGTPLLKSGGRLVAFIPVRRKEECITDCLPDSVAMAAAGLVMEGEPKEQVLSDILSRWLVSFVGV
ncbi:hypothetical protein ACHAWU_003337 [Discostella pseudostelligera]|uniref:Uncharacterized protein n=1 Tax=Discostella pseudostelligera TaxID=259834 RepID=A0ABD3NBP2_9STRA